MLRSKDNNCRGVIHHARLSGPNKLRPYENTPYEGISV